MAPTSDGSDSSVPRTEKRAQTRTRIQLKVLVATTGTGVVSGHTEDLSTDGASLRLDVQLPAGSKVQIRFLTPFTGKAPHFDVNAIVKYATITSGRPACRVGVKLVEVSDEALKQIKSLLSK